MYTSGMDERPEIIMTPTRDRTIFTCSDEACGWKHTARGTPIHAERLGLEHLKTHDQQPMYARGMTDYDELANRHAYHAPTSDAVIALHEGIRELTYGLAQWLNEVLPESREKSQALTDVDNAMMHANAAVARHMNG